MSTVSGNVARKCLVKSGKDTALSLSKFPRPLGLRFPRAGNTIPKGWEHDSQGLGIRFPRAGTSIPRGWHSMYPRLALDVPAAGTRCTRGWHFDCPRLALRLPAAGNAIACGWHFDCLRLDFDSQGPRIFSPAAGRNLCGEHAPITSDSPPCRCVVAAAERGVALCVLVGGSAAPRVVRPCCRGLGGCRPGCLPRFRCPRSDG